MSKPLFLIKNIFEQELFPVIHSMYLAYRSDNGNDMSSFESEIRDVLNKIVEEKSCVGVTSTFNPDKPCFGVYVNPTILDEDLVRIIFDKEEVSLTRYAVEIDLKMFDYLNPEDIAAILIEEITTVMSCNTINTVRALLETIMSDRDISINFRQSVNFNQLLIFGIKDTIRKVASVMYKPTDEDGVNEYAAEFGYSGVIADMIGKLHTAIFDASGINVNPKLSVLSWVLTVYNDPNTNYSMTLDDLKTAALMTGSKLEKDEIGKTITSLTRAANEFLSEATLLFEGSLFKNLKQSGLRSIEDDLYEYKIRVKTCETEDDAMYILHQISTRINILEDYLYNTPGLTEMEYQRWTNVINAYKELRIMLGKKPIVDKKRYGIFVDYDYLDTLDKSTRESADIDGSNRVFLNEGVILITYAIIAVLVAIALAVEHVDVKKIDKALDKPEIKAKINNLAKELRKTIRSYKDEDYAVDNLWRLNTSRTYDDKKYIDFEIMEFDIEKLFKKCYGMSRKEYNKDWTRSTNSDDYKDKPAPKLIQELKKYKPIIDKINSELEGVKLILDVDSSYKDRYINSHDTDTDLHFRHIAMRIDFNKDYKDILAKYPQLKSKFASKLKDS